ncbi:hypothetical protein [Cylindrospermopsis raciborskii]|uniref:Uncharacterized protein n=2 Tax=Cylindrospermopsis raciborskii TaxID=77022 RepID=A0A9Q5QXQ3_9CYAN|nr:hypothetical protein [Cylindrospermopsis raciborskii]MCZ2200541.1 hypothetical protein [Cylindrospermopsis raciborskii PAMP2012]NLQ03929.1 hypothetical protein [Cylindrospermopsis raciborskii MVCC19]OHY33336.1 hypothetical protein BCV64_10005 [Cylindrospermopsis raciborskii MVCC14]OPH10039.1 hypothetical protein CENA302_07630 [Cylindrospermopsis raciborskii CENA302]
MPNVTQTETKIEIEFPCLPLAVYREIAAHLCQVKGVHVELVTQTSPEFDYHQSQIKSLYISWQPDSDSQRIQQILGYYQNRYHNS